MQTSVIETLKKLGKWENEPPLHKKNISTPNRFGKVVVSVIFIRPLIMTNVLARYQFFQFELPPK